MARRPGPGTTTSGSVWRGQSSYRIATLLLAAFVVKASDFRGGFLNFTYAFFDNLLGVVLVDGRHVPLIN